VVINVLTVYNHFCLVWVQLSQIYVSVNCNVDCMNNNISRGWIKFFHKREFVVYKQKEKNDGTLLCTLLNCSIWSSRTRSVFLVGICFQVPIVLGKKHFQYFNKYLCARNESSKSFQVIPLLKNNQDITIWDAKKLASKLRIDPTLTQTNNI